MKTKKTLYDYCLEQEKFHILAQWNKEKNHTTTPKTVTYGSSKKVWWRCDQGHEWETTVTMRATQGTNCPYCAGLRAIPGVNDFETAYPELVKQWHPTKNGDLRPCDVTKSMHKDVWWQCEKGHEWKTRILTRTKHGSGCPVCAGKTIISGKNDLQSNFPEIAKEWHPTLNGDLTPNDIMQFSNRTVWWICENGHEYPAPVARRTKKGSRCPFCANRQALAGFNDLATRNPEVTKEWHPTLNGDLTPEQVTTGSNRKVWWQCPEGHEWQAMVASRTKKGRTGCPVCAAKTRSEKMKAYRQRIAEEKKKEP